LQEAIIIKPISIRHKKPSFLIVCLLLLINIAKVAKKGWIVLI
jgi:hypothetical protein